MVLLLLIAFIIVTYYNRKHFGKEPSKGIMVAILVVAAIFFAVYLWPSP